MIYVLNSIYNNTRIHVSTYVENNGIIETSSNLYESGVWLEREIWDMFGIYFEKHPDLRRILTDYGFVGYPLKKDFPITGYLEVYYDVNDKKIIYKPIELMQEYRNYNFGAVWGDYERKVYLENIIK
jgi:NADH-quinone oxidoreductase subunit C